MNNVGINFKGNLYVRKFDDTKGVDLKKFDEVKEIVEKSTPENSELDVCRIKKNNADCVVISNPNLTDAVTVIDTKYFVEWFKNSSIKDIAEAFIRMENYSAFQDELCSKLDKIMTKYFRKRDNYETMKEFLQVTEDANKADKAAIRKALRPLARSVNRYKNYYQRTQEKGKEKFDEIINSPTLDVFKEHGYLAEHPYIDEEI